MRLTGIFRQMAGTLCLITGGLALVLAVSFAYDLFAHQPADYSGSERATCQSQMTDGIGLGLRTWAMDHHDQFPFNVSTNEGGTRELCARGGDAFDSNAWMHFRVASNELSAPAFLVCPKDRKRKPARDFQSFGPKNVTYRLRSGPNVTQDNPNEVLVVCPLHGMAVCTDGHLVNWGPLAGSGWRYTTSIRQGVGQILLSLGAAAILFGFGGIRKRPVERRQAPPRPAGNGKRQLMSRYCLGVVCRLVGAGVAMAGLAPAATLINPWRKADKLSPLPEIYFATNMLKAAAFAAAGFLVAYILLRVGSHLKSKNW